MEQRADMKKTVLGLSLGLGSWVLGIPAWAQAVLDTGLSAEILNQPVTTPFRRPGLLRESSRPVYVITRQQMREQGARTVQEALRYLPGILSDGTAGTQLGALSSQFLRGARTAQVLVLLDGRPLNDLGFFGGFDLSQITTDVVERIEVSPGGGSTLYGSDAVGGVINIVTVEPQPETETVVEAAVGSYGLNEQGIQSRGQGQELGWVLSYSSPAEQQRLSLYHPTARQVGQAGKLSGGVPQLAGQAHLAIGRRPSPNGKRPLPQQNLPRARQRRLSFSSMPSKPPTTCCWISGGCGLRRQDPCKLGSFWTISTTASAPRKARAPATSSCAIAGDPSSSMLGKPAKT
jgi:hypothetical protein